ncbi:YadA family autotransporter adhesin [Caballeronia terrestris]|nr:YadA family autotransporter adhesin [Caballeronia terrestris]
MDTDAATVGQLRASGLVDASGEALDALTYDAGSSRASVTLAGIGGTLITNVKAGELSADSTDAVNGAQLFALAGDTSNVYIESNGSGVKYARTNDNNLAPEDAHAQGVGSTAVGYNAIASASDALALGRGAQASFADSVALGAGSRTTVGAQANYAAYGLAATQSSAGEVNVGNRQITGVAAGSADTDAVNVAQLKGVDAKIDDVSAVVASVANSAVKYDDASQSKVTLGGADGSHGPVTIANVASGTVSADSKEAINGSQLFELQNSVTNTIASAAHSPFVAADGNSETEAAKASGTHATALGANASAAGNNGTALGANSVADAANGTALGAGAKASNDNAVALGANSTTDRANSVSVGSEGNERQITNVAAGTQPNDAVNFSQLQGNVASGVANANAYTDSRVNQVRRDSFAGVAAAMAIAGLPASSLPGRGMVAVAGSNYRGESAVAMGVSALSESGKIAVKITGTTDGHGEYGVTAGAGVHW